MSAPICKIRLPSHHPAVAGLRKGDRVHLIAEKAEEEANAMSEKPPGPQVPPLETPFHVNSIAKARGAGAALPGGKGGVQSPAEYLNSRRRSEAGAVDSMS